MPCCYTEWSEESTEAGWKGEGNITSENAYSFRIDRLRADGKVLLTDTTFDMKEYLTEADSATADVRGVFYDGEAGNIYIPVSSVDKKYTCAQEYKGATEIAQKWIKENQPSWENAQVFWFWAMDEAPDGSIIYYAMV